MTNSNAGSWQRNGRHVVIDLPSSSSQFGDAVGFEYEAPPPRPVPTPAARPRVSLGDARKQLRAFLKDAKALKANAKLGNPGDASPFVDAFQAAINKAKPLATAYTAALRSYTPPRVRAVDEARQELQTFLEDAEALKDWGDPNEPALKPFLDAYLAARDKAKAAAAKYAAIAK